MATFSVIIPATDGPSSLDACVGALESASERPEEIVVVDDEGVRSPASARNLGALRSTGEILVFVDADVVVHGDAFERIRAAFECDETLDALFGSYDDAPPVQDAVSGFRNLLHHHVHQQSSGEAQTFWAGLGAIRRETFDRVGGFVDHPVEDIELGMRLYAAGARIRLDPSVLGTHMKRWSLLSMIRTDLLVRGAPWVGLLLRHRSTGAGLNLGWKHRLSALAALALVVSCVLLIPLAAAGALLALVALNARFYALLVRRRGIVQGSAGIALHFVHILVSILAVALGVGLYVFRHRAAESVDAPVESQTA